MGLDLSLHCLSLAQVFNLMSSVPEAEKAAQSEKPKAVAEAAAADDEDDDDEAGKKVGRRKINIEFIEDKSRRHITFSKRKSGIMKKAYELSALTGTQVLLLVASETGHVYTYATEKLQPLIQKPEGKNLIQTCLSAPDSGHPQQALAPAVPAGAPQMAQPEGADRQPKRPRTD